MIKLISNDVAEIKQGGNQISKLNRISKILTHADIAKTILKSAALLNRSLPADVIPDIAEMICEKYYYMKIEEFDLVMKRGVQGAYGDPPMIFSAATIFHWLSKYECSEESVIISEKRADNYKKEESKGRNYSILESPEFREKLKEKKMIDERFIYESSEEDRKAHTELVKKQAEEILKGKEL